MDWTLLLQLTLNGLIVGALYGVVAMSFVLIYKASQVVNFAQGEFLLVGAWICWWFLTDWQLPFWMGFLFTLAFMTVFAWMRLELLFWMYTPFVAPWIVLLSTEQRLQ